jgi:hypothetical protein
MPDDVILTANSIITMDPALPRATALAIRGADGTIAAVGDLAACQAALPGAEVRDLADTVLMPGFIDSHSHPLATGLATQPPAIWIAPYVGYPTWDDVVAKMKQAHAETPAGRGLVFNGFDRLLHGVDAPTAADLDAIFGDRPVMVADNSGHGAYFSSAVIRLAGWDKDVPADPVGGYYGRTADGQLNGQGYELPVVMTVLKVVAPVAELHPLGQAAAFMAMMARNGITATTDLTYEPGFLPAYEALMAMPSSPLRVALYHVSTDDQCTEPLTTSDELRLWKQGVKLWADGSPWIGNIGLSFPYEDTEVVRKAGIPRDTGGEKGMNYSRTQLDALVDRIAPTGLQLAIHVNGDLALDIVLDAYQRGLVTHGLTGSNHRWRLEHLGAARDDQLARAGSMGLVASLGNFQFIYWGDLLDGQLFPHEIGANWIRTRAAIDGGTTPSYHNDGAVSPPLPLLNVQMAVARTTNSGAVRGLAQAVPLDEALKAITINAAYSIGRDHDLGSISVGKQADLVELSRDPYQVEPSAIGRDIAVRGTWLGGQRIDPDAFVAAAEATEAAQHAHLTERAHHRC